MKAAAGGGAGGSGGAGGAGGSYTSFKWITAASDAKGNNAKRTLVAHDVRRVYEPVLRSECNLISIFGRARQGKSFLMNCLAGEGQIFKISNEKESCTQGIDISEKWLTVNDFSKIDGGKACAACKTKVGFVDAEGQGDRDVSYDANLICPILLASKCVIFNWKGDLQKDHIISTLGIMTRAAQNVAQTSTETKKFGHLHIVFRDWQSVDTDTASVYQHLFGMEKTGEGAVRDQIRKDVLQSFETVTVWLFDAPSDSTAALKTRLTIDRTSAAFRQQVRELRGALASQLRTSTLFAGRPMTGQTIGPLVSLVADALNRGETVLPHSAYVSMMRQEVDESRHRLEAAVRACAESELKAAEGSVSKETFASKEVAARRFAAALDALVTAFEDDCQCRVGDLGDDMRLTVMTDTPAMIERIRTHETAAFMSKYAGLFAQWLMEARRRAEQAFDRELAALGARAFPLDAATADAQLIAKTAAAVSVLQSGTHHASSRVEMEDSERQVRLYCDHHATLFRNSNNMRLSRIEADMKRATQEKVDQMRKGVNDEIARLVKAGGCGYPQNLLENKLNERYFELEAALKATVEAGGPTFVAAVVSHFEAACKEMHRDVCAEYAEVVRGALRTAEQAAARRVRPALEAAVQQALRSADGDGDTGTLVAVDTIRGALDQATARLLKEACEGVAGWTFEVGVMETVLVRPLRRQAEEIMAELVRREEAALQVRLAKREADRCARQQAEEEAQRERAERERARRREVEEGLAREARRQEELNEASARLECEAAQRQPQQKQAAADKDEEEEEMEVDGEDDDDEEEEEEEEEVGARGARGRRAGSSSSAGESSAQAKTVAQQRRDAEKWAKENCPNAKVARGKAAKSTGAASAGAVAGGGGSSALAPAAKGKGKGKAAANAEQGNRKSVEQQRADAEKWYEGIKQQKGKAGASSSAGAGAGAVAAAMLPPPPPMDKIAAAKAEAKEKEKERIEARVAQLKKK